MTNELGHPDGLPVSATPFADKFHDRYVSGKIRDTVSEVAEIELRARAAEACLYEIAWDRLGTYASDELAKTLANLQFELARPTANPERRPWTQALAQAAEGLLKNRRDQ